MRAILIDSEIRQVRQVDVSGLEDMQRFVGGSITTANVWEETGDYCFVDDEGLLKPNEYFFFIRGCAQPFAGNGLIVGPEDLEGNQLPVGQSLEKIQSQIVFLSRSDVRALYSEEPDIEIYHA
jgi:hypothetical protein